MSEKQGYRKQVRHHDAPDDEADDKSRIVKLGSSEIDFWCLVWFGIALSGSLFGLLFGLTCAASDGLGVAIFVAFLGAFVGLFLAGVVAVPVILTIATASWAVGTVRCRAFLSVFAGGVTGTLSTLPIAYLEVVEFHSVSTGIAIALAASLGTMGAFIAIRAYTRRGGQTSHAADESVDALKASIVNRLFRIAVLMAVIAVALAACYGVASLSKRVRETSHRDLCSAKLKQIALCLNSYHDTHGHFPQAYITDKMGKPVLSWRVAAARSCYYNLDFSELLDVDQPWNSPKNAKFLDGLGDFVHCPASGKKSDNPLTDYVVVVGSETLWPGMLPSNIKNHPKGILVVEWPNSDIHWAEPRDITVEEFLNWFRKKPTKHDSLHPGYLLYVDAEGNIGKLRNDTDPETVRKLLVGQSTADAALSAPDQR